MDIRLENRRAIVTGSTAGIGYAIAAGLAASGVEVVVTGRTRERVDAAMAVVSPQADSGNRLPCPRE